MVKYTNKMAEKRILNRIKGVLADKDKTNLWLAEKLGKNKSTVSKWCTNDQQPTLETLFDIAAVLGVAVCELLVEKQKK
jgi:transcriptional regulator with XRE-family HTH domain